MHLDIPHLEDEDIDHEAVEPMEVEAVMPEANEYGDLET
jgi:hypothetical protein